MGVGGHPLEPTHYEEDKLLNESMGLADILLRSVILTQEQVDCHVECSSEKLCELVSALECLPLQSVASNQCCHSCRVVVGVEVYSVQIRSLLSSVAFGFGS